MRALIKASEDRFGEDVELPPTPGEALIAKTKTIPVEYVNDELATWPQAPGKVVTLRKTAQGWKLDLSGIETKAPVSVFSGWEKLAPSLRNSQQGFATKRSTLPKS